MLKTSLACASAALVLLLGACASTAAAPITQDVPLPSGPPISSVTSPYDGVLKCLNTVLTDEQRKTAFGVASFQDSTGKTNYVSESGTGTFSTQGGVNMAITSLAATGVTVIDTSTQFRQQTDWVLGKMLMTPQANPRVSLSYADVTITGAITAFDFMPGAERGVRVAGVGASQSQNRVLVRMDGYATRMIGVERAGTVIAADKIKKQIVGTEQEGGITSFFGPTGSPVLVDLHAGERNNEPIQYIQGVMIDRLVGRLVADSFGITACDEFFAYGDTLAVLQ